MVVPQQWWLPVVLLLFVWRPSNLRWIRPHLKTIVDAPLPASRPEVAFTALPASSAPDPPVRSLPPSSLPSPADLSAASCAGRFRKSQLMPPSASGTLAIVLGLIWGVYFVWLVWWCWVSPIASVPRAPWSFRCWCRKASFINAERDPDSQVLAQLT